MAEHSEGRSPAAWTAVGIILFGCLVMSVAVAITTLWLFVVGAVLVPVGAVVGRAMAAAGRGGRSPEHSDAGTSAIR